MGPDNVHAPFGFIVRSGNRPASPTERISVTIDRNAAPIRIKGVHRQCEGKPWSPRAPAVIRCGLPVPAAHHIYVTNNCENHQREIATWAATGPFVGIAVGFTVPDRRDGVSGLEDAGIAAGSPTGGFRSGIGFGPAGGEPRAGRTDLRHVPRIPCRRSCSRDPDGSTRSIAVSAFSRKARSRPTPRRTPAWSPIISVARPSRFRFWNRRSRPTNALCGLRVPGIDRRAGQRRPVSPTSGSCTFRTSESSTCWRAI